MFRVNVLRIVFSMKEMKEMKGMKGMKDVQKKMHFCAEVRRRGWDDGGGWRQVFSWWFRFGGTGMKGGGLEAAVQTEGPVGGNSV